MIFISSKDDEYTINLTQEEIDAIPIILNMANIYTWELYSKKETDKFYEQHKENIDLINEYHNKGYQGILAVGEIIKNKCNMVINNKQINDVLKPLTNYTHVYCTNCIHIQYNLDCIKNSGDNACDCCPCNGCACADPEDSERFEERYNYKAE